MITFDNVSFAYESGAPVLRGVSFHIAPGDQLMVLGDEERGLALVDANFFLKVAEVINHGEK